MSDSIEAYEAKVKARKEREWATIPPEVLEVHNALVENARKVYPDPEDFKAWKRLIDLVAKNETD